jgi:alginate O-acetyltransferase complex protein AlgI
MTTLPSTSPHAINERETFRPWFRADWLDVLFLHYAIDPAILQPHVPFDLDLHDGKAWVSLVAFTQADLRPARGGALTSWITAPVRTHAFLNLRTYVKAHGHRGIYFLTEWIPNLASFLVGPSLYGLPFRLSPDPSKMFHVEHLPNEHPQHEEDLTHFLLERYTAFTCRRGRARMFHIAHDPWSCEPQNVCITDDSAIRQAAPWFADARLMSAHSSPGVRDVEIGPPIRVSPTRPVPKPGPSPLLTWTPLPTLTALALASKLLLPAWAYMWAIAFALFFGCKWATWFRALDIARRAPAWKSLSYLLAWPGMDARAFLCPRRVTAPAWTSWIAPTLKTLTGALILFTVPRLVLDKPLLAGWLGMSGLILALHFGAFELLALAWRRAGVDAKPVMDSPWRSGTLGEFWGQRWNRGFRDLSHGWLFRPLLPVIGPFGATYITFVVSGLVHDLVVSVPAGAGYLMPTLYFLLQAAGLLVERTPWVRGHTNAIVRRLFTVVVTAAPIPLLFHNAFVINVIVPFFRAIGAM